MIVSNAMFTKSLDNEECTTKSWDLQYIAFDCFIARLAELHISELWKAGNPISEQSLHPCAS